MNFALLPVFPTGESFTFICQPVSPFSPQGSRPGAAHGSPHEKRGAVNFEAIVNGYH